MNPIIESLKVKLYADGADISGMIEMASKPHIAGFTTNPTLMRKAGVNDYVKFAKQVLQVIKTKPVSFEVFSDDLDEMKAQGEKIASWGENVFVKIPVMNTKAISTTPVVKYLSDQGVKVNVTALMTQQQVVEMVHTLNPKVPNNISVFAGRIADTGRDPMPIMKECVNIISGNSNSKLIWASPREILNVFQADQVGCQIITATNDILKKLDLIGMDLEDYSLDTVKMFFKDAKAAGFLI